MLLGVKGGSSSHPLGVALRSLQLVEETETYQLCRSLLAWPKHQSIEEKQSSGAFFPFFGKGSPLKSTNQKRMAFFPLTTGHLSFWRVSRKVVDFVSLFGGGRDWLFFS